MLKIRNDEAFTGLEAAIVLIAFVVVAAVFSYVVLGAGFFTTQKSQEVVYTSVDQASSSIEILGDVYGIDGDDDGTGLDRIRFTVGLTAGGSPVDFNQSTMTYSDATTVQKLTRQSGSVIGDADIVPSDWNWVVALAKKNDSADLLLENQEQFTIIAELKPDTTEVEANKEFTLSLRPAVGTAYSITRTAPSRIEGVNALY
jgi:flagellin FlaB